MIHLGSVCTLVGPVISAYFAIFAHLGIFKKHLSASGGGGLHVMTADS